MSNNYLLTFIVPVTVYFKLFCNIKALNPIKGFNEVWK